MLTRTGKLCSLGSLSGFPAHCSGLAQAAKGEGDMPKVCPVGTASGTLSPGGRARTSARLPETAGSSSKPDDRHQATIRAATINRKPRTNQYQRYWLAAPCPTRSPCRETALYRLIVSSVYTEGQSRQRRAVKGIIKFKQRTCRLNSNLH